MQLKDRESEHVSSVALPPRYGNVLTNPDLTLSYRTVRLLMSVDASPALPSLPSCISNYVRNYQNILNSVSFAPGQLRSPWLLLPDFTCHTRWVST